MNLDIDPAVQLDVIANFASEAALIAQGWLLHSLIIEVEPYIEFRASERVLKQRAPSRLGKPSYADCEILETYILFADHLRKFDNAIDQPIVFVSSNTRDFMRNQIVHDDVAQDFYPLGMTYAKSMFEARRVVLAPY